MNDHVLIRIERRRYVYFTCPEQPSLEMTSFDEPKICPICRMTKPVQMGCKVYPGYSADRGAEVIPITEDHCVNQSNY